MQKINARNEQQKAFNASIFNNTVTLGIGLAGTGKTLLSLYQGFKLISDRASPISKIIYVRANVGVKDEVDIGSLPGEFKDKMFLLAQPVIDNLLEFKSKSEIDYYLAQGIVEVINISSLRGRSLADCLIIVDEVQNLTIHGLRTVVSRLSRGSKLVLIGDPYQSDIEESPLIYAVNNLKLVRDVGCIVFTEQCIVRHPLIGDLLKALA